MSKVENSNPNLKALEDYIEHVKKQRCCLCFRSVFYVLLLNVVLIFIFLVFSKFWGSISWSANVVVMLWLATALSFVGLICVIVNGTRKFACYQRGIIKLKALQFEISAGTGLSGMEIRDEIQSILQVFETNNC